MGMSWTEEQKKVIELRNRDLLVSAAAGSGKTAVLVQRILSMLMDPEHPIDIDRLLIMTFTRAAAGEMKERIAKALEDALYQNPDNEHLQRQLTLIHAAQITTIDGFCAYVIRNYFHTIDLDPGYRVADEGELKLLREDVAGELLEEYYAKKDKKFLTFVECYASGKTDEGLKDRIFELYQAAMSHPDPKAWLTHCLRLYQIETVQELADSDWMQHLWEILRQELSAADDLAQQALAVCRMEEGPYLYEDAILADQNIIQILLAAQKQKNYDGLRALLTNLSFTRLPAHKSKKNPVDESKKTQVKNLREEMKKKLKDLGEKYFQNSLEELLELIWCGRDSMEMLAELTLAFSARFSEKKREKNILDFTDMEHFALRILSDGDGPSAAAKELSEKYLEVLVDEYQDSNLVQEKITTLVSGESRGQKNIFMVGDVKQSIYRFRLARPDLFMDKLARYSLEDGREQRIDLHKNFRSRPQVLEGVNYLFRQIMAEDLGGVIYDDAAALYPGASFPESENEGLYNTEVLLVEKDGEVLDDQNLTTEETRELEALAVAHRIREIVGQMPVLDKKTGEYRPAEYGDIVVLFRSVTGWAEVFSRIFSAQGIPAYSVSRTGYFSATEVVAVLNYLRICDNPYQDIPLAGVLRSPIVGCTVQELALLRAHWPQGQLYESVLSCIAAENLSEEAAALQAKLQKFQELLTYFRDMAIYTPVHQLIQIILDKTGYGNYACALPDGEQRHANLSMLAERAMDYEKTSYRGLFNFIRYIEHLQKYEVDYGEVNLADAGKNSVRIMTVHKSKGLEFPIVFACGMGKTFNFQDLNAKLLIHPELGLGADAIFADKRVTTSTLHKQIIRRELLKESLGEELRILYVAFTRAKEKLILTGIVGKLEQLMEGLVRFREAGRETLSLDAKLKGKSGWSYVLPALAQHPSMDALFHEYGFFMPCDSPLHKTKTQFIIHKMTMEQLVEEEVAQQSEWQMRAQMLKEWDEHAASDPRLQKEIRERFTYRYPYAYLQELPVKLSVSEIKKRSYQEEADLEEALFFEPDLVPLVPQFIQKQEPTFSGAAKGTAYHRFMECLQYENTENRQALQAQLKQLREQGRMSAEESRAIRLWDIQVFLSSPLGQRMKAAALEGRLHREQPFVISMPAGSLDARWADTGESILVQGIIDAYFSEDGEIVLVDYKTDHVTPDEEQQLIQRYSIQLQDYAAALARMTGKQIKEKLIYSFTLGKELPVP